MADEIINRVAKSKLVAIDLEDYYPKGERVVIDIKNWLFQEQILREKEFRDFVKKEDWSYYKNKYVALSCSSDVIIPSWAYLLIGVSLQPYAAKTVVGNLELLETVIYSDIINKLPVQEFKNKPIIIKGCSNKPIPQTAYTLLISKLMPQVKSIMYGEACSSVPLCKKKGN